jgi:CRP-like cAMP-binding protein
VPIVAGNGSVAMARLTELDPALTDGLGVPGPADAAGSWLVPVVSLTPGPWSPAVVRPAAARAFALLVVEGLVVHDLRVAGSTASALLGPGDLAGTGIAADALVPVVSTWTVVHPSRIALLDARLGRALERTPLLATRLLARAADECARLAAHRAIVQLPRVEDRLLGLFGHLAERWGRVGPSGLIVPLHLTHEMIGRLVGARRPTVSLGLKALAEQGMLERRQDGSWLIAAGALDVLQTADGPVSPVPAGAELVEPAGPALPHDSGAPYGAFTAEDRRILRARAQRLRQGHETRVARADEIIERSRAAREESARNLRRARALAR